MQTFLTSTDPHPLRAAQDTFRMLDMPRLGKQRVEALQLLNGQWENHPAAKMWREYPVALTAYGIMCCKMWITRGGDDNLLKEFRAHRKAQQEQGIPLVWPWWYSHPAMVRTHQTKLFWKGSERWVSSVNKIGGSYPPMRLPYLWPQQDEGEFKISAAESKRSDWEIPSAWSYDAVTRLVIPR